MTMADAARSLGLPIEHMEALVAGGWKDSNRKAGLPKSWPGIRRRVLEAAGHRCQVPEVDGRGRKRRCWRRATEVDHINRGDDHRMANLRAICQKHHREKSSREGNEAQAKPPAKRAPEQHPGRTAVSRPS